jgi:hypothetical protein
MKNVKEELRSAFNKKEVNEQNEKKNPLSRRSFMKQSLVASAGVVASTS